MALVESTSLAAYAINQALCMCNDNPMRKADRNTNYKEWAELILAWEMDVQMKLYDV